MLSGEVGVDAILIVLKRRARSAGPKQIEGQEREAGPRSDLDKRKS